MKDMNSDKREFDNEYPDYDGKVLYLDATGTRISKNIEESLRSFLYHLVQKLEVDIHHGLEWHDYTVYTGTAGIAMMYVHLARSLGVSQYLQRAIPYIERPLPHLKGKKFSFLGGDAGLITVGALLYKELGQMNEVEELVSKLGKMANLLIPIDSEAPDELLYGRVGYLYSLLYIQRKISARLISNETIREIIVSVLESGKYLSNKTRSPSPLMYQWHDTYYLGAAHGLSGILYMLMQAKEYLTKEELNFLVKPSIDYILSLKFPSGNYPSSLGKDSDRLVHWCHGAPGMIHMFALGYEVFRDTNFLDAAKACADVIWKRGLLRKGYGLCHGVAGNGYGFLKLFQVTRDQRYLYRAVKFAEWCYDLGAHGCRIPDRPHSLFEGLAGTIYFLTDLMQPLDAAFPAFQLPN